MLHSMPLKSPKTRLNPIAELTESINSNLLFGTQKASVSTNHYFVSLSNEEENSSKSWEKDPELVNLESKRGDVVNVSGDKDECNSSSSDDDLNAPNIKNLHSTSNSSDSDLEIPNERDYKTVQRQRQTEPFKKGTKYSNPYEIHAHGDKNSESDDPTIMAEEGVSNHKNKINKWKARK